LLHLANDRNGVLLRKLLLTIDRALQNLSTGHRVVVLSPVHERSVGFGVLSDGPTARDHGGLSSEVTAANALEFPEVVLSLFEK